jgi:hypothetical protein
MMRSLAAQLGWRATSYKGMGFLTELTCSVRQLHAGWLFRRALHLAPKPWGCTAVFFLKESHA